MSQQKENPYPYSDTNKRYQTFDYYTRQRFGGKCAKVTLDIGCTCPNKDGTRGKGGCIYCKDGSRSAIGEGIGVQYENGIAVAGRKWKVVGYIPYFQSGTNTYGDISALRQAFFTAAGLPGAVMLGIGTRADCLGEEILELLAETAEKIPVMVELGLQSVHDRTAERINRGHSFVDFLDGYDRLYHLARQLSPDAKPGYGKLSVGIHLINGLPGETEEDMLASASVTASLRPDMVKIHLLHVLRDTALAGWYGSGAYTPMEKEAYTHLVCRQLRLLPPETIIGRITGDGMADDLLAPQWSRRKTEIANAIDKEMYARKWAQGDLVSDGMKLD
ncbi:MAG: TIGR01212 family radical SAM protein [Clostridia bacterium]|nr:TIGR01212 family radical SAM protein [Clostridia bacterium]